MANPYYIEPVNPLQALMTGVQGYEGAQKRTKAADQEAAFREAGQQITADGKLSGNVLARLIEIGPAAAPVITAAATLGKGDTTDEIKEYNLSKTQGFTGSFTDWKTALKKAGATNIKTTVNSGEKSYDTEVGKDYAKTFIEGQKAGRSASGQLGSLDVMERATQDPNFYSGAGAERFVLPIKQAIGAFGGDPNSAASMETFRAQSSKAALDSMGGSLGSGFSNADREFVLGQVPNLGNTPEGNRALIGINRKVAQRTQEIAKQARDYVKSHGRMDAGFDAELADWAVKNPLFPQTSAPSPAQPRAPASGPARPRSKAERDALPPGTEYIAPDGSTRTRQ